MVDLPSAHHFLTQRQLPLQDVERATAQGNLAILSCFRAVLLDKSGAGNHTGEIGLYEEPEERYGRLVMDAFLTTRLVVDTGMNALGWSLERARQYMREQSRLTEAEILTESVRYSCDIPGQALAYKLGDRQILALRNRMRRALGSRFDLKDFHAAILEPGALPMTDLEWHIEREIERRVE